MGDGVHEEYPGVCDELAHVAARVEVVQPWVDEGEGVHAGAEEDQAFDEGVHSFEEVHAVVVAAQAVDEGDQAAEDDDQVSFCEDQADAEVDEGDQAELEVETGAL